ncbi:MAG: hypothetical protein ABIR91_02925 [Candidatus Saccharimonadales bacterium]
MIEDIQGSSRLPLHSSGIAHTAHGASMGATTHETYGQRSRVNQERQVVGTYGTSQLMQPHLQRNAPMMHGLKPRTGTSYEQRRMGSSQRIAGDGPRSQAPAFTRPQARFTEPPARYNPYG